MTSQSDGGQRGLLDLNRRESSYAYRLAHNDWLPSVVRRSRVDLPGSVHAASAARQGIVKQFGEILTREEQDLVRLLVSELINNAVVHGGADADHHVIFHLAVAPERLRAEVCDGGPGLDPGALPERNDSLGGKGFIILDGLASRWGVSTRDGTCVWFELDR